MSTREGYFCPVLQHKDVAHQIDDAGVLHVFEIDDAVAPGAKELCRVEPLLAVPKRTADEHGRADPIDAAVVSFRFQAQQVRHSKNATLDVVGENNEIIVAKRDVASELVNNFTWFAQIAVLLLKRTEAASVFLRKRWLFSGGDSFSNIFHLHGV